MQRTRLRSSMPRTTNGDFIRNVPDLPRGPLNDGISIPSQEPPEQIRQYDPPGRMQPDIRSLDIAQFDARGLPNVDPGLDTKIRRIQHPGGIRLTNYSTTTLGTLPTLGGHARYKMRLALPLRPARKRFVLCNPDPAAGGGGSTMFFSFQNNPNSLIPLYVGQVWDESGSEISCDDLWIAGPNVGDPFIVYEGRLNGAYE